MRGIRVFVSLTALGVLTACPDRAWSNFLATVPRANIGAAFTLPIRSVHGGWTVVSVTPPAQSWLSYDPTSIPPQLSGTPDGMDFGDWTVSVVLTKGTQTVTRTFTVTVNDPTATHPAGDALVTVPMSGNPSPPVAVTISPAPPTAYVLSFTKRIDQGLADLRFAPTSSDNTGLANVSVVQNAGGDYTGVVFVELVSRTGRRITIDQIPARSQ